MAAKELGWRGLKQSLFTIAKTNLDYGQIWLFKAGKGIAANFFLLF